jgi:hypothetical protein
MQWSLPKITGRTSGFGWGSMMVKMQNELTLLEQIKLMVISIAPWQIALPFDFLECVQSSQATACGVLVLHISLMSALISSVCDLRWSTVQ